MFNFLKRKINVVLLNGACMPSKAHEDDAGFDLYVPAGLPDGQIEIDCNAPVTISTQLRVEIPNGYVGLVMPRSSMSRRGLVTFIGVIDSGYTGVIQICMQNINQKEKAFVYSGERIAQLVIVPIAKFGLVEVDFIADTERGNGGFGSTGK